MTALDVLLCVVIVTLFILVIACRVTGTPPTDKR